MIGHLPTPSNQPPYLTCLVWNNSEPGICDSDFDGALDSTQIAISAGGPFPGGPELFEWRGGDPDGDPIHLEVDETLPDWVSIEGLSMTMDPEDEHVGENFVLTFRPCDPELCGGAISVRFNVIQ